MKQNCKEKSISRNNLSDSDNSKPHSWKSRVAAHIFICVLSSCAIISLSMRELVVFTVTVFFSVCVCVCVCVYARAYVRVCVLFVFLCVFLLALLLGL